MWPALGRGVGARAGAHLCQALGGSPGRGWAARPPPLHRGREVPALRAAARTGLLAACPQCRPSVRPPGRELRGEECASLNVGWQRRLRPRSRVRPLTPRCKGRPRCAASTAPGSPANSTVQRQACCVFAFLLSEDRQVFPSPPSTRKSLHVPKRVSRARGGEKPARDAAGKRSGP